MAILSKILPFSLNSFHDIPPSSVEKWILTSEGKQSLVCINSLTNHFNKYLLLFTIQKKMLIKSVFLGPSKQAKLMRLILQLQVTCDIVTDFNGTCLLRSDIGHKGSSQVFTIVFQILFLLFYITNVFYLCHSYWSMRNKIY